MFSAINIVFFSSYFRPLFGPVPFGRNTPNHHHQILPGGVKRVRLPIEIGKRERAGFQLHVINDQPAAFHVQDLHARARAVDENEHLTVLNVAMHQVGHHAAQGIKTLSHIRGIRIQVVAHRGGQVEHAFSVPGTTKTAASPGRYLRAV